MSKHKQQLKETVTSEEEKTFQDKEGERDLQIASLHEKNLLLAAEVENQRKAQLRETEQFVKYANRRILLKIIPLVENYKRALLLAEKSSDKVVKSFVMGFEMVLNGFKDGLKSEGVEEYSPQPRSEVWNSSFCEVVDEIENNQYEEGTVMQVVQGGYLLHKRLLSPARVLVSKKSKPTSV